MPVATTKMTPKLIAYFLCGMRHPTTGLSEDDLSRLTGSSSSTASCGNNNNTSSSCSSSSSTSSRSSGSKSLAHKHHQHQHQHQQHHHHHLHNAANCIDTAKQHNHSPERPGRKHTSQSNNPQQQSLTQFTSTYLPEFINPLEWQKSRKRKERLDSTSNTAQERKLQRSNSEELLPQDIPCINCNGDELANNANNESAARNAPPFNGGNIKAADVIRRVCSEDFKKSSTYAAYAQEFTDALECGDGVEKKRKAISDENNSALVNVPQNPSSAKHNDTPSHRANIWAIGQPTRDTMARRSRNDTSPARSQRFSPVRGTTTNGNGNGNGNGKPRDSDDSECEHERRRSSERFCKTRAPPGRKASGISKKTSGGNNGSKYFSSRRGDECSYKYDIAALKYERRGFVSKKFGSAQNAAAAAAAATASNSVSDHNDNNLIDFNNQQNQEKTSAVIAALISSTPAASLPGSGEEENNGSAVAKTQTSYITAQEALPWERSVPEDQTPVLSRRYGAVRNHPVDNMETAAKLAKVMPYPQPFHKQSLLPDNGMDTLDAYRAFTSLENIRTRDLMQQVIPAMMSFQSPDERLKQVNKRLTALKKKLTQLEEAYETRVGYRPSQSERVNDKYMKNILAEISKLRKERHELKVDPVGTLGLKTSGGFDAGKKLDNMKTTLDEIEHSLAEKRHGAHRPEVLEELSAEQLLQEKTAVQHGLLYFEQIYGRPTSKDERDAARPLYTRYRLLKRLVSRSVVASAAPELPTILEHEAFESLPPHHQYSSNNTSSESTNTPTDPAAAAAAPNPPSSDDSTTTTTAGGAATTQTEASKNENVSDLNIEQLWQCLDKTREEKKQLKHTIREYESVFEEQNGRKMLKHDRRMIDDTYAQYKEKKAKTRLLQALIKKQIQR